MNIIDEVHLTCKAFIAEAEKSGGRQMTEDERKLFHLGFIAGVQHGLALAKKSLEELKELT